MNLLPRDLIHEGDSLPRILSRAGYHTVFAMDEVRFANIDTSYGFDQTITPPIGASEFLIAIFADTPLSNLVMNTRSAAGCFRTSMRIAAPRGTTTPTSSCSASIASCDVRQPAVPHRSSDAGALALYLGGLAAHERANPMRLWPDYYVQAARRVDQQFADVMSMLRRTRPARERHRRGVFRSRRIVRGTPRITGTGRRSAHRSAAPEAHLGPRHHRAHRPPVPHRARHARFGAAITQIGLAGAQSPRRSR